MSEYIDREAAINALTPAYNTVWPKRGKLYFAELSVLVTDIYNRLKAIPAVDVAPRPEWVRTKDRLPQINEQVLVLISGHFAIMSITENTFIGYEDKLCWEDNDCLGFELDDIDYWMPLPEQPSQGGKDNG